jgi:7,8-dihydropterin-6-yl-methyl-4-(beta-D-ribofuranosyl)aminobenzene 5'-phosphate synthase
MSQPIIALPEVDSVNIQVVMDNSIDVLMSSTAVAHRWPLFPNHFDRPALIAQHGFSVLVEARRGQKQARVLFDTGVSKDGILYNMDAMDLKPADLQAIILSHGHADHAMGLPGLIDRLGMRRLPLVLHPDAYLQRKLVLPDGTEINLPPPDVTDLRRENIELMEEVGPSMLLDDMLLVSGEVERTSPFEKGFPAHFARRNGVWLPDPLILDDQCAILNVRDKGLVIITGCGHAGIINTIRHAQRLTGVQAVHAVVGGFHLTGRAFEQIIPATVAALLEIKPRYVMPGHCTGWSATHQIARAMPEAFIPNSVGTTLFL